MRQVSVLFARFPYGGTESHHVGDWLAGTVHAAKTDPRISAVRKMSVNDTPITMTRNRVLKQALAQGVDVVCMVDSDMRPDLPLPGARPFWPTALDFLLKHEGPCLVAAPYCGPPPHENVYIFRWANLQSDAPDPDFRLEQFTREEAAARAGFEEVAALPTGLMLIDMRAIKAVRPPWFEYEYVDPPFNTEKASTEDVVFTRNLSLAGVPNYVLWDSWAGHLKTKCVGKPSPLTVESVREEFREALLHNRRSTERLIVVGEGEPKWTPSSITSIQASPSRS